ncbi:transporter substrate-binding domain-containing protein [Aliihoeflea aestuarii]|jgi:polar amino acid transport system substrate-binding protein|uniref:transporter substrate-binding domain-containing protein n=1 Tax=Aliihoeflea aestuarii TaxID=453840 RepID=UPI0020920706|nr:transporter substrate-binding domain-containing protein [Aliihoeflea aestuarii]MCO6391033.1 transporter substrate-binding domain-containing protein [Aliihoeflea aestuarii]
MKKLILASVALAFASGTALAQDVVRIGTEGAYPPYNFINDQNELDGFEREFGDALCERAELNCEWVLNDWDTIIPNLVGGNYDAIMAGMSITEARKQVIGFSQNYMPPDLSAYMAPVGADESVRDGVVVVQSNTMQASYVAETDATLVEFPTPDETIAAVRSGEADAVMADKDFLVQYVEQGDFEFVGEDIQLGEGLGIGLRQSDEELRDTFNAAIDEMKADGSLNELITKWFGADAPTF